jgi:hypothetical protein
MRHQLGKKTGSLGSAIGLVVAAMATHANAANLLVNPGFEDPADPGAQTDTTVSGWTLYGGDTLRADFENHTTNGTFSIWEQTFMPAAGGVFQNVTVPAAGVGTNYTLTGYYFFESAEPNIPGEVSDLALTFLNSSGGVINPNANGFTDETDIPSSSVTPAEVNTWTQFSVSGVAPVGTATVQVSFDFIGGSTVVGQQAAFVDDADLEGVGTPPPPPVPQWGTNGSGNWNTGTNWIDGPIPDAIGAQANFLSAITTGPQTVFTNQAIIAGSVHFNNANEYVIAGAPSLTLQTSTGNAMVEVDQGTDELDLPVIVASNTVFNVASGATLLVANPVTINSGKSLTQTGAGTVTYQSIITVGNAASIAFGNSTYAHELALASGSTASVGGTGTTLELDSLSDSGTLDLQKNTLIINYGSSADPIASIRAELASGYAGGTWTGAGIDSSVAATNSSHYGLGYADSADAGNPAGLPSGEIEVKYTLYGDANLDNVVSGDDFAILVSNLGKTVTGWDRGDFNYDGVVSGDDFALLVGNLGRQSNGASIVIPASDLAAIDAFAAANGLMADVPEPASASLLLVAGLGFMARRRRNG